jgi:rod shape-determining protein MreB
MNFLSNLDNREIGIDLGTANILIALKSKGIVLREPSVVALDKETKEVLAFGNQAKLMLGRTPEKIDAIKPMKDGVIADYTATKVMLKSMVTKVCRKYKIIRPRVVVGVPSGITEVERRAVEEAIISSGAGSVYLIDEPMAAAIGSGLNTSEPTGNIIVDIGGGTTEVAVISLGGIVVSESLKIAGDELTEDIINYAKRKLHIVIGEVTAENVKKQLACAKPLTAEETMEIRGRDITTGLPVIREISSNDVGIAIQNSLLKIIDTIKACLEQTPPELLSDIAIRGIMVAGGGALIRNLDKLISEKTDTPVFIATEPLDCVVKGTQKIVEDIKLKKVLG